MMNEHRNKSTRMCILVLTDLPIWQNATGAHARILALCNAISGAGNTVHLFYTNWLSHDARARLHEMLPGVNVLDLGWLGAAVRVFKQVLRRAGIALGSDQHDERRKMLQVHCARLRPRFVIVEYIWNTCLLEGLVESLDYRPVLMLDTIDVQHLRTERMRAGNITSAYSISQEEETRLLGYYDVLVAIQQQEAAVLRRLCPQLTILTAGYTCKIVEPAGAQVDYSVKLLFVGGGGAHNVDAIRHFLKKVWPVLLEMHGSRINLRIVGTVSAELKGDALPLGVSCTGYVCDLRPLYTEADIVINPIQMGSGLKIKNVEAICHGRPLVTTRVGAEGLESGAGHAFAVCNDDKALIRTIDLLIREPEQRERLARNARAFAQAHLRQEFVYAKLLEFLRTG